MMYLSCTHYTPPPPTLYIHPAPTSTQPRAPTNMILPPPPHNQHDDHVLTFSCVYDVLISDSTHPPPPIHPPSTHPLHTPPRPLHLLPPKHDVLTFSCVYDVLISDSTPPLHTPLPPSTPPPSQT